MKKYSGFSLVKNALSYHENWQKVWRSPIPKKHYDVLIVGGGGAWFSDRLLPSEDSWYYQYCGD